VDLGKNSLVELILEDSRSAFGESIRTLNWSISLSYETSAPPKVILVTSSNPGEGKSTVAMSLALSQAAAGQKVLLIDADTRWPSVHQLIEMPVSPGLTDLLTEQVTAAEVVMTHQPSGLHVLTAGEQVPNPSSLFGSQTLTSALTYFRNKYNLIILDSPPVMAGSDARVLGRLADATVMVVRFATTRHEVVKLCVKQLRSANANMAGMLLTDVDLKKYGSYDYGESGAYSGGLAKYYGG
jgi:capsular exopolysaccharide synthesis family protein